KWWADRMQVCGVNVMIPHSFNPRAPHDTDCPPYFYNGGYEPRFALYRVWADYSSRLSLMLTGGRHVCPVAVLFSGNARQVGAYTTPEDLTSALQDALYDCDWLPFERFEDSVTKIKGNELRLHGERYRALVVPPTESVTFATLEKARAFFESGGTVIGYGRLPERSLTLGKTAADIARLREAIWGAAAQPGPAACRTSRRGGRSYFLAVQPTPEALAAALSEAGVPPVLRVHSGETGGWVHALRRVDHEGRDVLFIANQNSNDAARAFTFQAPDASGVPEVWDAMRGEVTAVPWRKEGDGVSFDLTLEGGESALVRLVKRDAGRPARLTSASRPVATLPVFPDASADPVVYPVAPDNALTVSPVTGSVFQGVVTVPPDVLAGGRRAYLVVECEQKGKRATVAARDGHVVTLRSDVEPAAAVYVNGRYAGGFVGKPYRVAITKHLQEGCNSIRIEPFPVEQVKIEFY
ncbi:MAG: glycosyl hydrolase, partial [Kiritimatiellae bacterium]|nr:glycosyl hydrolase [Kiritimatiellia bacterium]